MHLLVLINQRVHSILQVVCRNRTAHLIHQYTGLSSKRLSAKYNFKSKQTTVSFSRAGSRKMSHRETHGNLIVDEGNEHPSKLNMEGQNAQHTSAAGQALPEAGPSRSRSNSNSVGQGEGDEKKEVGGKPQMEKYAYHSMSPFFSFFFSSLSWSSSRTTC